MLPCLPPDPPPCAAQAAPTTARLATPIDAVGSDLASAFGGNNLLFYAGAIEGSVALAFGGTDESIRDGVQRHLASRAYGDAAVFTGYALPAVGASALWVTGYIVRDRDAAAAGSAAVQALAVTTLATAFLKISVGRVYPGGVDAHTFAPFQTWSWPFAAWPSGHASSTVSVVAALTAYYGSDELWIPLIGYPTAVVIGFGMLSGNHHWTSDLYAGAILGQCIGWSIGREFRARARGEEAPRVSFAPFVVPSAQGVAIAGTW